MGMQTRPADGAAERVPRLVVKQKLNSKALQDRRAFSFLLWFSETTRTECGERSAHWQYWCVFGVAYLPRISHAQSLVSKAPPCSIIDSLRSWIRAWEAGFPITSRRGWPWIPRLTTILQTPGRAASVFRMAAPRSQCSQA